MGHKRQDFAETYSKMSDDELLRVEADRGSLVEEAKQALDCEIQRRQISRSDNPSETNTHIEQPEGTPRHGGSSSWARMLVFLALSAVGLAAVLVAFGTKLEGTAAEAFAEATTKMFLYAAFAGWGITQVVAGRWLTIKRTIIIAAAIYAVGIGYFAVMQHNVEARQERIHQLLTQVRTSIGPSNQDFSRRLGQILGRDPRTFAEFRSRSNELEGVLDSNDVTMNKSRMMLGQLQEEFADSPNVQSTISLLGQIFDNDAKIIGHLREEIACSRTLSGGAENEQSSFRERCIVPAQEKMSPLLTNEEELLRELQSKGVTLPPNVAEGLETK